ncbi:MAG: CPBP family intramembrane metalloprotease [Puniceicoccales bacterium]|nr:CPBP family intramembrane metalloprotease [Puniceicoccales bacterium]
MRSPRQNVVLFFLIYFGSYAIAALLAPSVYVVLHHCHGQILSPLVTYVLARPFGKVYGRICWIPLFFGLLFLLRRCGLNSCKKLGFHWRRWPRFLRFFLLGTGLAALLALVRMVQFDWEWRGGFSLLLFPLFSALAISVMEEVVFRGLLLRLLCGSFGPFFALPCSGLFFSYAHFTGHSAAAFRGPSPTVSDGFRVALDSLGAICCGFQPIPFLSLFLFGLLLGSYFLRYRNLMEAVGFHSGVVFALLAFRRTVALTVPLNSSTTGNLLGCLLCPFLLCVLLSFHVHGSGVPKSSCREIS